MEGKTLHKIVIITITSLVVLAVIIFLLQVKKVGWRAAWNRINPIRRMRQAVDYVFTTEQESYLEELHQDGERDFRLLIKEIEEETGYKVIITSGYRSFAKQAELDRQNGKNANPGYSYHNYGLAIDINAVKPGTWLRKSTSIELWEASGIPEIIRNNGFRWGGDFKSYYDPVHIDLPLEKVATLKRYAELQFGSGSNWNNYQGNKVIF